jgi:hypothetical protein
MSPTTWLIVALCIAEVIFLVLLYLVWRWGKPKREPPPDLIIMPNGDVVHKHHHGVNDYVHHHADGEVSHTHPYE